MSFLNNTAIDWRSWLERWEAHVTDRENLRVL
jgi:hypothetical protein